MKVIVDAMGGDYAPEKIIEGAFDAAGEFDVELILVGKRQKIEHIARDNGYDLSRHSIIDTDISVTMEDDPLVVLHEKKNSSMCCGLRALAENKGAAFVSAGNTGALFTAASLIVRKIPGIQRAAIAGILPMNPPVLLLDSGANVTVTDEYLEQFAIMGSIYMRSILGIERPRVGLLNNGAESCKGTQLQIDAYRRLSENKKINFVGNIEGNRVPFNVCDVLVTDGFTGNIFLKTTEGMGKLMIGTLKDIFGENVKTKAAALLVRDKLVDVKKNFDSAEYGGAPLLGLKKPVIKAHGSSKAKAIKNAIRQAISYSQTGVAADITAQIKLLSEEKKSEAANEKKELEQINEIPT